MSGMRSWIRLTITLAGVVRMQNVRIHRPVTGDFQLSHSPPIANGEPSTVASRRGPLDWMIRPHMPDIYAIAHRGQLTGCWGHLREPTDRGKLPNREPGGHGSAHGPEHAPGPDPGRPWPGQLDDPPAEEICRGTGTLGSQSDCPFVGRLSPPSPASGFDTKRPRCLAAGLFFCPNRALPHHVSHADRARIAKMPPGTIR